METISFALRWIATMFTPGEAGGGAHQDELLADMRNRLMSRYY